MEYIVKRSWRCRAALIFLCVLVFLCSVPVCAAEDSEYRTVRVAFPSQGGMSKVGEGGDLEGYNYNYLQELAEYAGWKLEFITFDGTTADEQIMSAMEMVQSGDADLLGPVLYSDSVAEMFEFPENNYGIVYTTLCTLEKSDITSVNYDKRSPLRIAVYRSADERNKEVADYLNQKGIDYELVKCDTTEQQMIALQQGRADVLSSITLSYFDETRPVAEFAPRPYYFVSTKGNSELMQEADEAIKALNYTRPHLQDELQDEFFGDTSGGYVLTEEEEKCIENLKSLNILCASNYAPYSSRSGSGEPTGLLVSLLNDFSEDSDVKLNYTFCSSQKNMEIEWKTGKYDCIIGLPLTSEYCAQNSLLRTTPVVSVSMGVFRKQHTTKPYDEGTVAVYSAISDSVNLSAFKEVIEYDTLDECFDAVESGRVDYGCANRLSTDYELYEMGGSYVSTPLLGEQLDICVAVSSDMDYRITSALNKYIYTLPDSVKTTYLSDASQHDARSFHAFIRANPVQAAGIFTIIGMIIIGFIMFSVNYRRNQKRNVELQKANAAMQQANAAKSEFLSRMSHDIRTPLNAILGFTELGKQDIDSRKLLEEDLERIGSSGEFLLGLVNDVLDMTKIESNAMELKPQPYSRVEFERQIETLVQPLCAAKKIEFRAEFSDDMPECLYVDKLRFNQIFFNLLSNAVKFTPDNGKVEFSAKNLEIRDNRVRLHIEIKDNGIGMSDEFQERMFDSFAQEQQHITGREGTGLGLSIVKSLVEIMHGTINVKSKLGKGSIFIVELTAELCESSEKKPEVQVLSDDSVLKGKKILMCEDHPINTRLACRLLEKADVNVTCTENGQEGLETFEKSGIGEFDLILMDIRMPVMDGIDASKAIRALSREDAAVIPIVAMTADAFEDDVQRCMDAGMNAHLAKPFDVKKLYETLETQLKKRNLQ